MGDSISYEIYELVHSLEPSEKAYFKKSLASRADHKLKAAFDAINKMSEFSEEQIKKIIGSMYSNIPAAHRLLRDAILRELARYHTASSPFHEANQLLSEAQIAFDKSLYSICQRCIKKGLKIAEDNELEAHRAMFWEIKIKIPGNSVKDQIPMLQTATKALEESARYAKHSAELSNLKTKQLQFLRWSRLTREYYEEFERSVDIDLCLERANELEAKGKKHLATSYRWYVVIHLFSLGRMEETHQLGFSTLKTFEDPGSLPEKQFKNWLVLIASSMAIAILSYQRKDFLEMRQQLIDACSKRGIDAIASGKANIAVYDVFDQTRKGDCDAALAKLHKMLQQDNQTNSPVRTDWIALADFFKYAHFLNQDYHSTLKVCNEYLANDRAAAGAKSTFQFRWCEMASCYMLQDETLFETKLRAMKRYLKNWGTGFDWENQVLKAMSDTIGMSPSERVKIFEPLYSQLNEQRAEIYCCIQNFDLLYWIRSLAENRPLIEVVKEDYLA